MHILSSRLKQEQSRTLSTAASSTDHAPPWLTGGLEESFTPSRGSQQGPAVQTPQVPEGSFFHRAFHGPPNGSQVVCHKQWMADSCVTKLPSLPHSRTDSTTPSNMHSTQILVSNKFLQDFSSAVSALLCCFAVLMYCSCSARLPAALAALSPCHNPDDLLPSDCSVFPTSLT